MIACGDAGESSRGRQGARRTPPMAPYGAALSPPRGLPRVPGSMVIAQTEPLPGGPSRFPFPRAIRRRPMRPPAAGNRLLRALLLSLAATCVARAGAEPESVGKSVTLPARPGPHWFWLSDILLHRTALFDADRGELLGTISSGTAGVGFVISPLFSPDHRAIYLAETYYARGVRGERTDVVTVYDATTLAPLDEIGIPPRRAEYFPGNAANALSDDGRFVAIFNLTPMTSLSVVDVKARRFATEVQTPGCSLVYAAGRRRFLMLCANGAALTVALDDTGQAAHVEGDGDRKSTRLNSSHVRISYAVFCLQQ